MDGAGVTIAAADTGINEPRPRGEGARSEEQPWPHGRSFAHLLGGWRWEPARRREDSPGTPAPGLW